MTLTSSKFDWLFKYKLHHLPFWFAYHYLWWTVAIGSAWHAANNIFFSVYSIKYCFYVIFQAIGVYFNLYFLIPRFLEKGRFAEYMLYLLATILVTAALIVPGYYVSAWISASTFEQLYQRKPEQYLFFFQVNTLPSTVASMTLGMSIKLTKNWIQSKRREQALEKAKLELEKEKLETELKFLKSQFNPHFLFNTINSIFVLINKNPKMASESLAKFSDILRYQLYECNEQQIPLSQELNYLENFIELQKLRHDHNEVTLTQQAEILHTGNLVIAPFVLMPFVENAFKHVSKHRDITNWIDLNLRLKENELRLEVSNSTSLHNGSSTEFMKHGGIGLKNVKRRLDLLYPNQHQLAIREDGEGFHVTLTLQLHERRMADVPALAEETVQS